MALVWLILLLLGGTSSADVHQLGTSAAFQAAIGSGKPLLVLFTSSRPACVSCARVAPLWASFVEQSRRSDVVVQAVDCARLPSLCAEHGVFRYPRIELFLGGMDERFIYYGSRRPEKLKQLLASRSQVPNSLLISHGMSRLTSQTYEQHLAHGTHLVMFHAHWCSHCRSMMPAYESLARTLASDPTVDIARVECDEDRDVCQSYTVKGYPTILLIVDGAVKTNYDGERDTASMLSFLHASTGRTDMPGSFAVSSVEAQRLAAETAHRHRHYGSGVARPLPTAPSPAVAAPLVAGADDARVERFAAELLRWTQGNRDAQGRVHADALDAKVRGVRDALSKPSRASGGGGGNAASAAPRSVGATAAVSAAAARRDDLAEKLAAALRKRGLNAKVQTFVLDDDGLRKARKLPRGDDDDGDGDGGAMMGADDEEVEAAAERTGAALTARGQTGGGDDDDDELAEESVAQLQQRLETELNAKLQKHLESGEISRDQVAAVKNFVGKLQVGGGGGGGGGAVVGDGNAAPDDRQIDVDVDVEENQFLSADDVRGIREAVVQHVEQARNGGVEPGQVAPGEGGPAGRYDQAGVLKMAEEKIRQELSQRMGTGAVDRASASAEGEEQDEAEEEGEEGEEEEGSNGGMAEEDNGVAEGDAPMPATYRTVAMGDIVDLNPVMFEKTVALVPVFVMFYAPWCKHCHTFEPVWKELNQRLRDVRGVLVAKFNCDKFQEFCRQKEIPSFPELVLFKSLDHQLHYSGARNVDSLHRYVLNHVPNLQPVGSSDGLHMSKSSPGDAASGGSRPANAAAVAVSNLWHIGEDEFAEATATPLAVILYTFPFCQHFLCKQSREDFEQLSNEMVDEDVSLAQVDCTRSAQMCDRAQIQKSPMGWYGFYLDGTLQEVVPVSGAFSRIGQLREFVDGLRGDLSSDGDAAAAAADATAADYGRVPGADEHMIPGADEHMIPGADEHMIPGADEQMIPGADEHMIPGADEHMIPGADEHMIPGADEHMIPGADEHMIPGADEHMIPGADERVVWDSDEVVPDSDEVIPDLDEVVPDSDEVVPDSDYQSSSDADEQDFGDADADGESAPDADLEPAAAPAL